jgi:hypothetical protein
MKYLFYDVVAPLLIALAVLWLIYALSVSLT